jgi:hypothetical protein
MKTEAMFGKNWNYSHFLFKIKIITEIAHHGALMSILYYIDCR